MNLRIHPLFLPIAAALFLLGFASGDGLAIGVAVCVPIALLSIVYCNYMESSLPPTQRAGLASIFVAALLARWIVATGVQLLVYQDRPGLFAPDEIYYDWIGQYGAAFLRGQVPRFPEEFPGIGWVIAVCYYLFGNGPLVPKFLNGLVGAWTAVVAALLATRLLAPAVGRRAGYLAALVPSLVLWGSLNTKDNATLLGSELMLYSFIRLRDGFRVGRLAALAVGVVFVVTNRAYEMAFVIAAMGLSLIFTERRHFVRNLVLGGVLVAALGFLLASRGDAVLQLASDESAIDRVVSLRIGYAQDSNSAVNLDLVDTSTPAGIVAWLPFGLAYFYLAPIPFTGTSLISNATTPEMIIWYLCLPSVFRGLRLIFVRGRARIGAPLLFYALLSSVGWSLAVTNVGSLYRYRAQVFFVPLICIAADQNLAA